MTIDEFFVALERVTKERGIVWDVNKMGQIRVKGTSTCPVCAVARMDGGFYGPALPVLGMSIYDAVTIATAADFKDHSHRPRLLAACGLPAEGK